MNVAMAMATAYLEKSAVAVRTREQKHRKQRSQNRIAEKNNDTEESALRTYMQQ